MLMADRLLIYTVAVGANFDLREAPHENGVDCICLTDQQGIEANGWQLIPVSPIITPDPFRSSREFKICPHRIFSNYERSIYVDSNVEMRCKVSELWTHLITDDAQLFGGFLHSFRNTVKEEFRAVRRNKLDHDAVLLEQMRDYDRHYPQSMLAKPYWGGVLARRHLRQQCIRAMETWYAHVLRYSRRDQLSLPLALSGLSEKQKHFVNDDIRQSEYHRWPVSNIPKPSYRTVN